MPEGLQPAAAGWAERAAAAARWTAQARGVREQRRSVALARRRRSFSQLVRVCEETFFSQVVANASSNRAAPLNRMLFT